MIHTITDIISELDNDLLLSIRDEFEAAEPKKIFNCQSFIETWNKLIAGGIGAIWVIKNGNVISGATGAVVSVEPLEGIAVVAQCFLFLRKEHRTPTDATRLMGAVEMFASSKKASRIIAAVCYDTMDGKQGEFLSRHGYAPYETRYYKNLTWEPKP